jgi:hypothetical protein
MPRRGRPTPWDITFLDDGLSRMELAVGWRQLAPPPFCYCISSPKSKFAPSAFVKQTQRLTATDGLAAGVLRRPCPNVAHVAKTEVPDFRLLSPNLLIPSDWSSACPIHKRTRSSSTRPSACPYRTREVREGILSVRILPLIAPRAALGRWEFRLSADRTQRPD